MKPGSAIIDVSIDQGGSVETSRPTTLAEPTFVYKGVTHFCVPNFTADIGRSASVAIAQAMLPYLLTIARHGVEAALEKCPELARGVYTLAREASVTSDYRSRIVTADEALAVVRSGQRVYIHNGCAEPVELVQALTRRGPELRDVEVIHMATMGIADYSLPEYEGHFRANALFIAANVRQAVQEGRADYTPIFLSEIEGLFRSGALPIDVALLQCTPPDHYGYMSFGPSVDITVTVAQCARHLIVEINDQMPRALGDAFLHVSRVNAFVETSHPLVEYPSHEVTGPAPRHRPQHRGADSRRRHHSDRHRRHPRSHAGPAGEPQGPRHPLRNGPRRRHRADPGRRHQRRAEDAASAQSDRRLSCSAPRRCSISSTITPSSSSTPPPTATTRS